MGLNSLLSTGTTKFESLLGRPIVSIAGNNGGLDLSDVQRGTLNANWCLIEETRKIKGIQAVF